MKTHKWIPVVLDFLLLALLFWVVRYWHSLHFGLYEDDLSIIPDAFTRSFSSLMRLIYTYIITLEGHTRPFLDCSVYFFSWLGWQIAGLWGPYLIGYFITIINIGLFYWLMHRVYGRPMALIAGFGYVLFSANTTQANLYTAVGHQTAMFLFFLSAHAYLSNKRLAAYVVALIILFTYETPFLLLLAVPLLKKTWNKALIKELIWNTVILSVMLAAVYILRVFLGDGRATGLGLKDLLITPIIHSIEGPLVSLGTYAYRPLQALRSLNIEIGLAILVTFCVFLWVLSRMDITTRVSVNVLWRSIRDPLARAGLPDEITQLGRLFVTGLAFLILAYPLTFVIRAYAISGRDTRVHIAAVVGSAIIVASIVFLFVYLSNGHRLFRIIVNVVISLELALLVGYGFIIQRDYVLAWQYQKDFWTELIPLIPDASEGTVILVDPAALHDTSQIGANYWNLPRVLYQLYKFPPATKLPPGVNRLAEGWQNTLVVDGVFQINSTTVYSANDDYGNYDSTKVIIIQGENGRLVRRFTINLGGIDYTLKPEAQPILPALPHGLLFDLMINKP